MGRSLKDKGSVMCEGVDPYKLKKTVADNNEKIERLKEEVVSLREQMIQNTADHKTDISRSVAVSLCHSHSYLPGNPCVGNISQHLGPIRVYFRLEDVLGEERENRKAAIVQLQDYFHNTVGILEVDLQEAKKLEDDAKLVS